MRIPTRSREAFDCDKVGKVLCKAYKYQDLDGEKIVKSGWGPYIIAAIVGVVICLCAGFFVWKRRVNASKGAIPDARCEHAQFFCG